MARKNFGTIKRGSRPQLPSGTEKDPIAVAVQSISDGIIDALQKSLEETLGETKEADVAIETAVDSVTTALAGKDVKVTVISAIQTLEETIKDRFTAVLMAMYGTKSVTPEDGYQKYSGWIKTVGGYGFGDRSGTHAIYDLMATMYSEIDEIIKELAAGGSNKKSSGGSSENINLIISAGKGMSPELLEQFTMMMMCFGDGTIKPNALTNTIGVFTDLGKISKTIDKNFSAKTVETLQYIIEFLGDKKGNSGLMAVIKALESNCEECEEIQSRNALDSISNMLSAICSLQGFNKTQYKSMIYGLKKLINLTAEPGFLGKSFGIGDKGLIYKLINNIVAASNAAAEVAPVTDNISNMFKVICTISTKLDLESIEELSEKIDVVADIFDPGHSETKKKKGVEVTKEGVGKGSMATLFETINNFYNKYISGGICDNITTSIDKSNEILGQFKDLGKPLDTKNLFLLSMIKLPLSIMICGSLTTFFGKLDNAATAAKDSMEHLNTIKEVIDSFSGIQLLKMRSLATFVDALQKMNKLLAVNGTIGKLAIGGLKLIEKELNILSTVVNNIDKIKVGKESIDKINTIGKLIVMCSAVMIIGGMLTVFMLPVMLGSLVFTACLSAFVWGVVVGLSKAMAKADMVALNTFVEGLVPIVALCGIIMLLGGYIVSENPKILIGALFFLAALLGFVWGLVWGLDKIFSSKIGDKFVGEKPAMLEYATNFKNVVKELTIMLGIAALGAIPGIPALLFAGLLWLFVKITVPILGIISGKIKVDGVMVDPQKSLLQLSLFAAAIQRLGTIMILGGLFVIPAVLGLLFGVMLKQFIKLQLSAFGMLLNNDDVKDWKALEKTLGMFTKAVILLGGVMLIGGTLFTLFPALILGTLTFGVIMIAFVSLMLLVFGLTSKINKGDRANVMGFGQLVALSGLTMVIGAMFMWIPGLIPNALYFGGILAVFLLLVLTGISLGTKMMTRGLKNKANEIALLVIFMGGIMLIGAAFMYIPGLAVNALIFTGILTLFLAGIGGALWILSKVTKKIDLKKTFLILGGIVLLCVAMGFVMMLLGNVANETSGMDLLGTIALMGLVLIGMIAIVGGVACLIHALDPIGGVAAIALAEAVIAGVVVIIWLLGEAFKNIAAANNALAEMKEIDTKKFGKTILAFGEVAFAVATCALANPLLIAGITIVAYNSMLMAGTIYVISNAVKDAAELSIATYDENGKVKGRRNLNEEDFTNAAKNVSTIISVLGGAIIDTYNKNPQIFEWDFFGRTPFGMVCKSCGKLGPMISKIAEGVKDYADLRIATYDENGKKKGSRPLTDADFNAAARNISTIISVLGDTVIQTYEKNPEMFAEPLIGQNQFTYVVRSCGRLGPMISKIAEGVKDYADLRIAIFDEKGQQTGSRNMTDEDFKKAADNISYIITTLGGTVMKIYNKNPEMFAEPLIGQNQFTYVVRSCGRLGEMISKIAEGVKDYADLRIAIFDEKGQQTGSRNMTEEDFQTASDNISLIITTLGATVMKVYKKNPKMFEAGFLESNDSSPFNMVVNSCAKLGGMISDIGKGIKDFANLTMNIYDDKGQVTGVRNMTEDDFSMATSNIARIITLLGGTLIKIYKDNPNIFDDGEDSDFAAVAASFGTLGEMVSNISNGIKSYADLRIDIYDDEGKVIGNRPMDEKDFEGATNNIGKIITTLGASIISAYKDNPDMFDDGEDSDFAAVAASFGTMGKMVADISNGIKNYADLRIDIYDDEGKVIGNRPMDKKDFEGASANIGKIITTLGKTIVNEYNKPENEDIFDDGEDSDFANVCKACTTMGSMVSTIAASVKEYANMTIDIYDKNGNVIGKKNMDKKDFKNAADAVSNIITTIGTAIISTYKQYPQLFEGEGDDTVFAKVRKSMEGTGKLVGDGAIGIATVMNLGIEVSDANKEAIAKKVSLILTILSESIQSVAYTDWDWKTHKGTKINSAFDDQALLNYKGLKVGNKGGTSPVAKVVQSMNGAGKLVTEGVFAIISLLALPKFDSEVVKQKAATAVYCVVGSIADTYEAHPDTFDDPGWFTNDDSKSGVNKVKRAMTGAAALVVEAADAANKVSALNIDWQKLSWRTTKIIAAIPQAIMNATLKNPDKELKDFWKDEAKNDKGLFKKITETLNCTVGLIDNTLDIYTNIGKMTTGENALNIDVLSNYLGKMIQKIPTEIKNAGSIIFDEISDIENVINMYTQCNTVIDSVIDVYKKANSAFKTLGAIKDNSIIESIGTNIGIMISAIPKSLSGLDDGKGFNPLAFAKISAFINSYSENIANLSTTFSMVPSDMSGRTGLISMLAGVNEQIKNTPDLTNFTNETTQLQSFVKSVNSINTFKLNSLTTLANALTTMSSKLGSLEKLTDVLANKVAVVLSHLTKRLDQSATTIKVAEKIQNERHNKITEALTQLKKLMSEPLNVSVTHKQEPMDQTTLSNAGTSTTDTQQAGGSTNVGTGSTTTPASPSTPAASQASKPKTQSKENKPNYLTGKNSSNVVTGDTFDFWANNWASKSNFGGGGRTGANK